MAARLLVTPIGYDDVGAVLATLGMTFKQLTSHELPITSKELVDVEHLFLNCPMEVPEDPPAEFVSAVHDFVVRGGFLYVSDWASDILTRAFDTKILFATGKAKDRGAGIVRAQITDPQLQRLIGPKIDIHFDQPAWHVAVDSPATTRVYLFDESYRKLAFSFPYGSGRVFYTSFHHHAQQSTEPRSGRTAESEFLEWLILSQTQHREMSIATNRVLKSGAAPSTFPTVGQMRRELTPIALAIPTDKQGLGVFSLAWNDEIRAEVALSYLVGDETIASVASSRSPLELRVRDSSSDGSLVVSCNLDGELQSVPFSFQSGLRRDLLGDSDWLPAAIARHIDRLMPSWSDHESASVPTLEQASAAVRHVLEGIGYKVEHREHVGSPVISVLRAGTGHSGFARLQVGVWLSENPMEGPSSLFGEFLTDSADEELAVRILIESDRPDGLHWVDEGIGESQTHDDGVTAQSSDWSEVASEPLSTSGRQAESEIAHGNPRRISVTVYRYESITKARAR